MKNSKIVFTKAGIILAVISLMLITLVSTNGLVYAQGQETCPDGGDWTKVDGLSGTSYTFNAPEGKLIAETCYKAATYVIFSVIDPPQASVTVVSTAPAPG